MGCLYLNHILFEGSTCTDHARELSYFISSALWKTSNHNMAAKNLRALVASPDRGLSTLRGTVIQVVHLDHVPVTLHVGKDMRRYHGDVDGCTPIHHLKTYQPTPGETRVLHRL